MRPIAMAPREPAVPGPAGESPQPNHLPMRLAMRRRIVLFVVVGDRARLGRRPWDHVFSGSPVAEIDQLATLAAKRREFVIERDFFFADRTLHCALTNIGKRSGRGTAARTGASSIRPPTRS